MSTFVLVHGAWQSAVCWKRVGDILVSQGHRVVAPDLLGIGKGDPPLAEMTLSGWTDQIVGIVKAQPEPVILVGHSRAGIIVSQVAEHVPLNVECLVYLSAPLVGDGQSLNSVSGQDPTAAPPELLAMHADGTGSITPDAATSLFFNTTPDDILAEAIAAMHPEPMGVFSTPLSLSSDRFGTVARAYIECVQDRALPLVEQRRMQDAMPCFPVRTLPGDHSPFYSDPTGLAESLIAVAGARGFGPLHNSATS